MVFSCWTAAIHLLLGSEALVLLDFPSFFSKVDPGDLCFLTSARFHGGSEAIKEASSSSFLLSSSSAFFFLSRIACFHAGTADIFAFLWFTLQDFVSGNIY